VAVGVGVAANISKLFSDIIFLHYFSDPVPPLGAGNEQTPHAGASGVAIGVSVGSGVGVGPVDVGVDVGVAVGPGVHPGGVAVGVAVGAAGQIMLKSASELYIGKKISRIAEEGDAKILLNFKSSTVVPEE
jgi:hypothetical protein